MQTHSSLVALGKRGFTGVRQTALPGQGLYAPFLVQALAGKVLLSRRGRAVDLRIGVARNASNRFEAPIWLKNQGRIIIGTLEDISRYQQLEGEV